MTTSFGINDFKADCRYFKADVPCKFHKLDKRSCVDCENYEKIDKRILIVKLGAMGDVIRTTPLLRKLKELYPNSEITWITYFPDVLPKAVDVPLEFNVMNVIKLQADHFDVLYSLDKDPEAVALANLIKADIKKGYKLENGKAAPIDADAHGKFLTGLHDGINKENVYSYVEEIFQITGLSYSNEKYLLDKPPKLVNDQLNKMKRPIIMLNTGCGDRWPTRIWPDDNWMELTNMLKEAGYTPLLVGGQNEDLKNKYMAQHSSARYIGVLPMNEFISLVNECDLMVTCATMALHIALGLEKKIVLMNNIFNKNEFELYGQGVVLEPEADNRVLECLSCFKSSCDKKCLELITPKIVFDKVVELMESKNNMT
ncbi:MAG: glycosyltransferase family 9 protein [Candidatus Aenigmatarchaeota archaeon]